MTEHELTQTILKDRIAALEVMSAGLLQLKADGMLEQRHLVQLHTLTCHVSLLVDGKLPPG